MAEVGDDRDSGERPILQNLSPEGRLTPVPHTVFCVSDVAPKDRFGLWKESISCIFDVERERHPRQDVFRARVEASLFGDLMLARTTTVSQSWSRSAATIARDGMDHYMIQLFLDGGMEAEHKRGSTSVQRDALVVFDLSQEVSSRTSDFTNLSLIVPRDAVAGQLRSPDAQHMRTLSPHNAAVRLLVDHMLGLERMKDRIAAAQARDIAAATIALAAACLNGAGPDAPWAMQDHPAPQMIAVKRMIERHLADPGLSVARIARMAGLSERGSMRSSSRLAA